MNELCIDKFYIELYERYKCNTKEELNIHEGEIIRQIGTMNMKIAGRTQKEYKKQYYQKPEVKEHIKQYSQNPEVKEHKKNI